MNSESGIFAAVDLGTNNCRLMIARPEGTRLKVLDAFSRLVCLGEGVSQTGRLSEEAMQRAIDALKVCADKIKKYPVTGSRFIATEACRVADNCDEFVARVKQETGMDLRVVSNKEEIILAFLGCSPLIRSEVDHAVLVDVGGGSTEFILINYHDKFHPKISTWFCLPYGMMNLTERFGIGDTPESYREIVNFVQERLAEIEHGDKIAAVIKKPASQLLCASGTITTIGAMHLGLARYSRRQVDGLNLAVEDMKHATRRLTDLSYRDRLAHPCIGRERADFVLSGAAIMEAVVTQWPVSQITIADRGVREGIILSLFKKSLEPLPAMDVADSMTS